MSARRAGPAKPVGSTGHTPLSSPNPACDHGMVVPDHITNRSRGRRSRRRADRVEEATNGRTPTRHDTTGVRCAWAGHRAPRQKRFHMSSALLRRLAPLSLFIVPLLIPLLVTASNAAAPKKHHHKKQHTAVAAPAKAAKARHQGEGRHRRVGVARHPGRRARRAVRHLAGHEQLDDHEAVPQPRRRPGLLELRRRRSSPRCRRSTALWSRSSPSPSPPVVPASSRRSCRRGTSPAAPCTGPASTRPTAAASAPRSSGRAGRRCSRWRRSTRARG